MDESSGKQGHRHTFFPGVKSKSVPGFLSLVFCNYKFEGDKYR